MTTAHNGEPEKVEPQDAQPAADPGTPGREAEEVPGGDSAAGGGSEVVDELEELVDGLRRERDEYLDLAQRAKADFENYRKRTAREAADAERRGKLALARDLVPSVDSLERAMAAADEGSDVARGLELVHGELVATLEAGRGRVLRPGRRALRPRSQRGRLDAARVRGRGRGRSRDARPRLPLRRDGAAAGARDRRGVGRRWQAITTRPSASAAAPPPRRSRRHTASSPASTTPTATPATSAPRSGSRRSRAPTTCSRTPRSARTTTPAGASAASAGRAVPAGRASAPTSATSSRPCSAAAARARSSRRAGATSRPR